MSLFLNFVTTISHRNNNYGTRKNLSKMCLEHDLKLALLTEIAIIEPDLRAEMFQTIIWVYV